MEPDVLATTLLRPVMPADLDDLHEAVGADPAVNRSRRGLARIVAVVRPDNAASRKVLARAVFREVRAGHHCGADVQVRALEPAAAPGRR